MFTFGPIILIVGIKLTQTRVDKMKVYFFTSLRTFLEFMKKDYGVAQHMVDFLIALIIAIIIALRSF